MVSSLLQSEGRVVWIPPDGAGGCAEERGRGEQGGVRAVMELVVVLMEESVCFPARIRMKALMLLSWRRSMCSVVFCHCGRETGWQLDSQASRLFGRQKGRLFRRQAGRQTDSWDSRHTQRYRQIK